MELKVLKPFQDKNNREKTYGVGDVITVDDLDRINDLVSRGICIIISVGEKISSDSTKVTLFEKEFEVKVVKDALVAIGVSVANNAGITAVNKKISELTEEQSKAIAEILCKE